MRRRRFLTVTAAGALTAVAGCTQTGDRNDPEQTTDEPTDGPTDGPGSQPGSDGTATEGDNPGTPADQPDGTTGSGSQAWGSGGTMNGVEFSFASRSPECGQGEDDVDITFDDEAGEVRLDGVISGSDLCKRASLVAVEHDESAGRVSATIEAVDQDRCQDGDVAAGQCIVDIEYEATFTFDDGIPSEASVSHGNGFGAGAAYGSSSVSGPTTAVE
jgi:hypothetical protein